jgi:SAM-dependent methyltransferase
MSHWNVGELETVACDHCSARDAAAVMRRPDELTVCECPRCGLAFLNPRPTPDRIARLYDEEYFAKLDADARAPGALADDAIGYATYHDPAEAALRATIMRQRLRWILSLQAPTSSPRILEIGCATGEFAAEAQRMGVAVTGIDIAAAPIRRAQERYPGIDFRVANAAGVARTSERFDAVVAFEVIEHVISPKDFLQSCGDLLLPGGAVVFSTPNYRKARILKQGWIGYHMSFEHLYFFSDETLARMGRAAGLDVIEWKTTGTGTLPPPNAGPRGQLKQLLYRSGLLPFARSVRTRWRALGTGETYEPFGSGHTLLMAFRKPSTAQSVRRAA